MQNYIVESGLIGQKLLPSGTRLTLITYTRNSSGENFNSMNCLSLWRIATQFKMNTF